MLPLIVVPSIAMLKPAGQDGSILSGLLSAASSEDESQAVDDAEGGVFSEFLESEPVADLVESPEGGFSELDALFAEASGMSLDASPGSADTLASTPVPAASISNRNFQSGLEAPQTESLMKELQQLGTKRTLWFDPGRGMFGFVAFFKAGNGIMSYRFESIAASREAAVQDVIAQARNWQTGSR